MIELAGEPVGFIQFYPWEADKDYLAEIGLTPPGGFLGARHLHRRAPRSSAGGSDRER